MSVSQTGRNNPIPGTECRFEHPDTNKARNEAQEMEMARAI